MVTGSAGKWYDGNVVGQIFYTGGNVGVNSDSPVYDLDVSGSGNFSQGLYVDGNAVLTGIASSSLGKWQDGNEAGEIFYDAGKVGVGTDNPEYDLHVDGNTYIEGSLNVSSEFKVGSNGAVGDTQPVQDGDIVKWDLANSKWSVGSNIPGGLVTGEVPLGFIKPLASGSSIYQVDFVEEYDAIPSISTDLQIEGDGDIIPYVISGVSASSYNLVFAKNLPNNNYRIHTTFGGRPVYWKTGLDASVNYAEGDVNILRDLTVSGNLTVDGTQLIVNTETIKLEDHNIEIAANAGYDTISDAGISWGTGIAGAASPVSLTYSNGQGFNFAGGNVGIGTMSPTSKLDVVDNDSSIQLSVRGRSSDNFGIIDFKNNAGTASKGMIKSDASNNLMFRAGPTNDVLTMTSAGNVGIGTTSPESFTGFMGASVISTTISSTNGAVLNLQRGVDSNNSGIGALQFVNANNTSSTGMGSSSQLLGLISVQNSTSNSNAGSDAGGNMRLYTKQEAGSCEERMRIDSAGNVGIGTTSPNEPLHVVDNRVNSTGKPVLKLSSPAIPSGMFSHSVHALNGNLTAEQNQIIIVGKQASLQNSGYVGYKWYEDGSDSNLLTFGHYGRDNLVNITPTGNVGIGTTSPSTGLHVASNLGNGDGTVFVENTLADYGMGLRVKAGGNVDNERFALRVQSAAGDDIIFAQSKTGNVGIGTTSPAYVLEVKKDTASWVSRIYNTESSANSAGLLVRTDATAAHNTHAFGVYAGGGYRFSVKSGGNVGIGSSTPGANLHIVGEDGVSGSQGFIRIDNDVHGTAGFIGDAHALVSNGISNQLAIRGSTNGIVFGVDASPKMFIHSNGNVSIGADDNSYKFYVSGSAYSTGNWGSSDDRLKHNEETIVGAIETLKKITPKKYIKTTEMYDADHNFELDADGNPVDEDGELVDYFIEAGVIAQEALSVDELAFAVKEGSTDEDGNETPHALNYDSLFTYAIAAIQEQQQLIESQQSTINDLMSRVESLES